MRVKIGRRALGDGHPCYIVAEAGVNHNGSLDRARRMIRVAKLCGADAIKFQSFHPDDLASTTARLARYQRRTGVRSHSQVEMLRKLALAEDEQEQLFRLCRKEGIEFLSTPFDDRSAAFLHELGVPAFKIGSGDLTNLPFLRMIAAFRKPMIVSTGMARWEEVAQAVRTVRAAGTSQLVVLQCTTAYPEPIGDANLRVIPEYRRRLRTLVGFSDHTTGMTAGIAAVALGACLIEKHFTLSRRLRGPDHLASLEPRELARFVSQVRESEAALGDGRKRPMRSERENIDVARKSVVARTDILAGTRITALALTCKRPGSGIPPSDLERLVGRVARVDIRANTLLSWKQVR